MHHEKEGWLLRVWAEKYKDVPGRVKRIAKMVEAIRKVSDGPIVVLVPWDKDCGETAVTLEHEGLDITVKSVKGSPNTDVLNYGLDVLDLLGCTHAIIVSNKAVAAVTEETINGIWTAFENGAKAVGVAFDELAPVVQEGVILNTFAAYDLQAACAVGKFRYEHRGEKGGVEEVSLLLMMVKVYGRCLAVVESGAAVRVHTTSESEKRHRDLQESKLTRVHDLLRGADLQPNYLQQFLMT